MFGRLARSRNGWAAAALTLLTLGAVDTANAAIGIHETAAGSNADGGATSLTVAKPANVAAGSFLLAQVTFEKGNQITVDDVEISPPNDWILVARHNFSSDIGQAIFRKVAHGSEPASYQWQFRKGIALETVRASGGIVRYSGIDPAAPIVAAAGLSGDKNPLSAPSVNAAAGSLLLAFYGIQKQTTLTVPAGMTSVYLQQHSNGSGPTIRAARELRANAGLTGVRTSSAGAAEKWVAQQVALRPLTQAAQSITFPALADRVYGAAEFDPGASASSGLAVSYDAAGACAVVAGQVRVVGVGECSVTASQAGNGDYAPAVAVTRSFAVARAVLSVNAEDASKTFGEPDPPLTSTLTGFVNGEDAESAGVTGAAECAIAAGVITCAPGTLAAANYSFETGATGTLTILKASQTITFPAIADNTVGSADFDPAATASSGLAVTYAASPASVCTIAGGQVHLVGIGTCTVTASQGGNEGFHAAPDVARTFKVLYRWDGYLQPINDTAHTGEYQSTFKLGSTIPVKFRIKDVNGTTLQQSTVPTFQRGANRGTCDTYISAETVSADAPTGGSGFRWDESLEGYIYNFSTKGLTAGEYRIYANLADGSQRSVDICLRK